MHVSVASLVLVCSLAPGTSFEERSIDLVVGRPLSDRVEPGDPRTVLDSPTRRLKLHSTSTGKATIAANSLDFDAYLRIETEAGDVLAEADDGGVETNARAVVDLVADRVYHVLVTAKGGGSGWFWVDCRLGERPALSREAMLIAGVTFHGGAANAALADGDKKAAASHLERKGSFLFEQSKFEEAGAVWDSARSLWSELKEQKHVAAVSRGLARVASALGDLKAADERFAEALAIDRALPDAAGEAETLIFMAAAKWAARDSAAATSLYREALGVAEKNADPAHAALALQGIQDLAGAPGDRRAEKETAEKLADLCRTGRDFDKAREFHQKALEIARETKDRAAEGEALAKLGEDWLQARDFVRARECFDGALRIARDTKNQRGEAQALGNLAEVRFELQDYRKALEYHEQQLAAAGADPIESGRANLGIAKCSLALRDYDRARSCLDSELERARVAKEPLAEADAHEYLCFVEFGTGHLKEGSDHRNRATELRRGSEQDGPLLSFWEGYDHLNRGEVPEAEESFEKCLEQARSSGDLPSSMKARFGLGQCHLNRGRYAEAIRCFSEMVDIARTLGRRFDEGIGLESLGVASLSVGALESARAYFEDALSVARETSNSFAELQSLNGLANALLQLHREDEARAAYEQVRTLAQKLKLPFPEAVALNNIGVTYWQAERFAESRPFLEQGVEAAGKLREIGSLAEFQGNLARVLRKLGEREQARKLADESLDVLGSPEAGEALWSLIPLEALLPLALADGDLAGARAYLDRAEAVLDQVRVEAQAAPEEVGVDPWILCTPWDRFRQDMVRQANQAKDLAADTRAALLAQGFRDADRARARHLTRGIVGHRRGTRSKDALSLRAYWKQAVAELCESQKETSRAMRDGRPSEEVDRLQEQVGVQRKAAEDLGAALREVSPVDAALDFPEGVDPAVVRASGLTKEFTLIEYAEGDEDLYAYVLTDTELVFLDLGKRKAADDAVARYLVRIGAQKGPASPSEIAEDGRALFDLLLARPLAAAGRASEKLLIVPTPSLAVLPFDALVVSAKPDVRGFEDLEFVIDRSEVDYCPSASILSLLAAAGPRKTDGRVLVLADPLYPGEEKAAEASDAESTPSILSGTRAPIDGKDFQRLLKTREEAMAIADLLIGEKETEAQARRSRLSKERSGILRSRLLDLCLGSDGSAARLGGDLRGYSILHLAAHGLVDTEAPERTGIALSWSGSGAYEGFFKLADAVQLDLDANLVVLSACDTARGKMRAGEGVESMASAFLSAGARGVVASAWPVPDWAAAETMTSVYRGILERKKPAEALHAAKLAIRRGSHSRGLAQKPGESGRFDEGNPCDWAPFVHIGLPR